MTRENAKALLRLITAFANGEAIETKSPYCGFWSPETSDNLEFSWGPECYRIKPAPQEFWIYGGAAYRKQEHAEASRNDDSRGDGTIIHVREVEK